MNHLTKAELSQLKSRLPSHPHKLQREVGFLGPDKWTKLGQPYIWNVDKEITASGHNRLKVAFDVGHGQMALFIDEELDAVGKDLLVSHNNRFVVLGPSYGFDTSEIFVKLV